jgi:predicted kinase
MRVLLILRGAPGCGKSTWIKEHGLEPYTLSADALRLMYNNPMMYIDGTMGISQENGDVIWDTLYSMLEFRMRKGAFTVIDATNSKTSEMNHYKQLCQDYRYRIYLVDFTTLPIEEVKELFKKVEAVVPYSKALKQQAITGSLSETLNDKMYTDILAMISKVVE